MKDTRLVSTEPKSPPDPAEKRGSAQAPASWHGQVALIAGGKSSRMEGQNKALLEWRGRPLWQWQVDLIERINPRGKWLLRRAEQAGLWPVPEGWRLLEDEPDCGHPMQAALSLLRTLGPEDGPLLLVPVDMPRLTADWLKNKLLCACEPGRGVVLRCDGFFQPLVACYPVAMVKLLEQQIASGDFRWQTVIAAAADVGLMNVVELEQAELATRLVNVNAPTDWHQLEGTEVVSVAKFRGPDGELEVGDDEVAVEGPLEIRVGGQSVAVVMRTPGHDEELAAGFLVSESVIHRKSDVFEISACPTHQKRRTDKGTDQEWRSVDDGAVVDVLLTRGEVDLESLTRHVFAASSCGICGKATIDAVLQQQSALPADKRPVPTREVLLALPDQLRERQAVFERTGGLHAAGVFDFEGNLLHVREDVGRHNAVDKLLGRLLLDDHVPAHDLIMMVSGRISFEIMQKALSVGLPVVAAVSAPTSLAVDFAKRSGQMLVGFLRNGRANVYAGDVNRLRAGWKVEIDTGTKPV